MTALITMGVILLGFAGFGIWLYYRGRKVQRADDLSATNKVKDVQLDKANQRRDPGAVADRLRKHDF